MKRLLFLIALLAIVSCQNENNSDGNNEEVKTIRFFDNYSDKISISSFVETIDLIPLETTDENLIGEITRIIFHDNKYYIRSTHSMQNAKLFVFDETGKYIGKIGGQGNGPGEYIEFKDFTITNNNHLIISDYQKLLNFSDKGEFFHSIKLERSFSAREILYTPKNEVVAFHSLPSSFQNYLISKIDKNGNQELFFNHGEEAATKCSLLTSWRSFISTDSCYYLKYPYSDTIFSISLDLKKDVALYFIDYEEKGFVNVKIAPEENVSTWLKKLKEMDDYLRAASFGIGNDFIYIGSTDKAYKGYLTFYSQRTKKSFSTRKLVDDMYLKGNIIPITAKRIPHNMDGNDIIWEIDPQILLDGYANLSQHEREKLKQEHPEWERICTSLKEEDNPVLFRIKTKKF